MFGKPETQCNESNLTGGNTLEHSYTWIHFAYVGRPNPNTRSSRKPVRFLRFLTQRNSFMQAPRSLKIKTAKVYVDDFYIL